MRVLYTAAHGGFAKEQVPLGGGAAVFDHLTEEWERTKPFSLECITPAVLGKTAPAGRDLVRFSESNYARFCFEFERASTEEILKYDPSDCVVLVNDVSEGPDFARLAARGYRIFTIYHVDVVAYVTTIYLRNLLKPETTVRWAHRLRAVMPKMARLIWEKQEASVKHSRGLIVPSEDMRDVLLRCYPTCPATKIHVLPWGSWEQDSEASPELVQSIRQDLKIPNGARVLLTLSRISPEKGQDVLLEALFKWEQQPDFPDRPLWLIICGDAAYMQGQRFLRRLKTLAAKLRKTRVHFAGHVTGDRKRAFFALADLYIFPSRHESYGLTLLEALGAGLPAICLEHHGARSVMRPDFGAIVSPDELPDEIARLLNDDALRSKMGASAKAYARTQRFSERAEELAQLMLS
jgi:glycosyltransferase involved in cell wall biosynthesis